MAEARRLPVLGTRAVVEAPARLGERPPCEERVAAVVPVREDVDVAPFAEALAAAAPGFVVKVGEELPARCIPALTILITRGLPESVWRAVPRALRAEADLVLADPRPGVARALGALHGGGRAL